MFAAFNQGIEPDALINRDSTPVEAATLAAAILSTAQATRLREASSWQARLPPQWRRTAGLHLGRARWSAYGRAAWLLVLLFTQLLNSAASITTLGHKQMDADSQARQLP